MDNINLLLCVTIILILIVLICSNLNINAEILYQFMVLEILFTQIEIIMFQVLFLII